MWLSIKNKFSTIRREAASLAPEIPLIGGLTYCSKRNCWDAGAELISKLILSLSPIWIWVFYVLAFTNDYKTKNIIGIVKDTVSQGELLLYCTSLLAPIFYMALSERHKSAHEFPNKLSHIILVVSIIVLSSVFYSFRKVGLAVNTENVFPISAGLYSVSVFLIYLATVYKNSCVSPSNEFQLQEENFKNRYKEHRIHPENE